MFDYIRWVFKLDFCTPRYLMTRELGIEKLKIRWSTRTRRFEERIKGMGEDKWLKKMLGRKEKKRDGGNSTE